MYKVHKVNNYQELLDLITQKGREEGFPDTKISELLSNVRDYEKHSYPFDVSVDSLVFVKRSKDVTSITMSLMFDAGAWDKMADEEVKSLMALVDTEKSLELLTDSAFIAKTYDAVLLGFIMTSSVRNSDDLTNLMMECFSKFGDFNYPAIYFNTGDFETSTMVLLDKVKEVM